MTEHAKSSIRPDTTQAAARQAGDLVELLDIMWEQARSASPPPNVPASQLRVMYLVDREDGIRMRALIQLLGAAPPSVSRLVDRLQALGFVQREPCPDSRREILITTTRAGRTHLARIRQRRDALLIQTIATMPARQRTALTQGLAGFHRALTEQPMLRLLPSDPVPSPLDAEHTA
ncbi:MarR family transcriptional regulator [Streptomyces griseoluteus]|uniref:MarR family transcriptional regulator n=1 Tax=Streptomyces griseoluteus TaxID=29306 RepID=A0A4Z1CYY5_STRGP|nr:MarR family transcriptional regulator [Streptomyces griseoluteus]TGN74263.1 MarR family transcriptional regulator [Streptomyces griseoluteus]GHF33748.1 MarR family transcriptional regulator [Streptomyces griseoluteus]